VAVQTLAATAAKSIVMGQHKTVCVSSLARQLGPQKIPQAAFAGVEPEPSIAKWINIATQVLLPLVYARSIHLAEIRTELCNLCSRFRMERAGVRVVPLHFVTGIQPVVKIIAWPLATHVLRPVLILPQAVVNQIRSLASAVPRRRYAQGH
jgi:hypothetical protein